MSSLAHRINVFQSVINSLLDFSVFDANNEREKENVDREEAEERESLTF